MRYGFYLSVPNVLHNKYGGRKHRDGRSPRRGVNVYTKRVKTTQQKLVYSEKKNVIVLDRFHSVFRSLRARRYNSTINDFPRSSFYAVYQFFYVFILPFEISRHRFLFNIFLATGALFDTHTHTPLHPHNKNVIVSCFRKRQRVLSLRMMAR